MKKQITTTKAPGAIGPYSQGIDAGVLTVTSGQLPIDVTTGKMPESVAEQTTISLQNVKAVLEAKGLTMASVIKTTVYLDDLNDFAEMNEVYKTFFEEPYPARSAFEVARLPLDAKVEIEVFAVND